MLKMEFQIKILLTSFVATLILSVFVIPILKRFKIGQLERDDGPRTHLKKEGTPTMGGIIMLIAITIASIGGYMYYATQGPEGVETAHRLIPLVAIAFGFGLIGFIDDMKKLVSQNTKGISPKMKMLGLLVMSVCFVLYLTQYLKLGTETLIPFFKTYIEIPIWIYIPFAIFVMVATTNAINLTDGVDGLASSIATIIITCLTVVAIVFDVKEIIVFGSIAIGVCLGFLLFNLNPARIMMGDTGSLLLGGIISAIALYLKMPLILIIIALIPVLETLSVIIQVTYFQKTGKRVLKMAPLHHHFELSGWKENKVVSAFAILTLILCIIGLYAI